MTSELYQKGFKQGQLAHNKNLNFPTANLNWLPGKTFLEKLGFRHGYEYSQSIVKTIEVSSDTDFSCISADQL